MLYTVSMSCVASWVRFFCANVDLGVKFDVIKMSIGLKRAVVKRLLLYIFNSPV
jgi:hypothetical protein